MALVENLREGDGCRAVVSPSPRVYWMRLSTWQVHPVPVHAAVWPLHGMPLQHWELDVHSWP